MTPKTNNQKQATKMTKKTIVFSTGNKNLKMEWSTIFKLKAMTSQLRKSSRKVKTITIRKLKMLCSRMYSAMSPKTLQRWSGRNSKHKMKKYWLKGNSVWWPMRQISQTYLELFWHKYQWWCALQKSRSQREWSWRLELSKTWFTHISISLRLIFRTWSLNQWWPSLLMSRGGSPHQSS